MKLESSIAHRRGGNLAEDQRAHRQAVIHMRRHHAAALRLRHAVDDQVVAFDFDADAAGLQHGGGGGKAVALLDPQFGQAAQPRDAAGGGAGDRRGWDIRRSCWVRVPAARPMLQRLCVVDGDIADRLAALDPRIADGECGAHFPQRLEQAGAQLVEADGVHVLAGSREPVKAGDHREGGGGRIARHRDIRPAQLRLAESGRYGGCCHAALTVTLAPKWRSMFSEWSRVGSGSSTSVMPRAFRPASRMADFTWAEATGRR